MKLFFKQQTSLSAALVVLGLASIIFYLAVINYRLPFLTMDELRVASMTRSDLMEQIRLGGRSSQYLAVLMNTFLLFEIPDIAGLTPRFISMLVLVAAIFLSLRRFGFALTASILISGFAVLTHQLDWQHNGLIAFFGGYNLLLGEFLLAIIIFEWVENKQIGFVFAFTLVFFSFASELFVGLAAVYVVSCVAMVRTSRALYTNPMAWATAIYLVAYLYLAGQADAVSHSAMENYLAGGLARYSYFDIVMAFLLYFINSIPLYNLLGFSNSSSAWLALVVLAILTVVLAKNMKDMLADNVNAADGGKWAANTVPLVVVLVFLAVSPQFLMAIQPLKHEWIMRGGTTRYVFSLYTWISLVMLGALAYRNYLMANKFINYVLAAILVYYLVVSVNNNLRFTNEYKQSKENWLEIERIVNKTKSGKIMLPDNLLQHPNILPVDEKLMKRYVQKVYGRDALICSGQNGYILSNQTRLNKNISLEGFSVAEEVGRWTSGPLSMVRFLRHFEKGDVIELTVTGAFSDNSTLPVKFEIGGKTLEITKIPGIVDIKVDREMENPVLSIHIPNPTSPSSLGISGDTRELGIRIKMIRVFRIGEDGREQDITEVCH